MDGDLAPTVAASGKPAEPLTGVYRRLVNEFQRGLPASPRPFDGIAARLGWTESSVLAALADFQRRGVVSRVGPVIRPNTVGASALAAMAVPPERLEPVAALVSRRPEVNHNYEREHRFNLWFVLTAADAARLDAVARRIEADSGLPVMVLPMLSDYYIDLGFDLDGRGGKPAVDRSIETTRAGSEPPAATAEDRRLLAAIQDGLPLTSRPYRAVGEALGMSEDEVCDRIRSLLETGVIKRLGVIVRHHECGWRHNAMVVWDVADAAVDAAGRRLAGLDAVRLCYRRPRRPPEWRYNLFCMIHGRDRGGVLEEVDRVTDAAVLQDVPREILFSRRRFKQRGARYGAAALPETAAWPC